MKIKTSVVFEYLLEPNYRNYVFQGSSRASKTYNIVLWLVIKALQEQNKVFSIVRKTLPALKGSVLRDLKEILIKLELYEELFKLKKTLYNDEHDITIFGYEVELYVQDENETHFSSGVYSVLHDKWKEKPSKEDFELDEKVFKQKVKNMMDKIDITISDAKDEPTDVALERVNKLRKKIKELRGEGLKKEGEFSYENLMFKFLRRNGYIQKLFDYENERVDKEFSIEHREMDEEVTFGDAYSKLLASKITGLMTKNLPGN